MSRRPVVVVVGSANADSQIALPALPRPGETVLATGHDVSSGGKGANQAVAVARAGAECWMVGAVGDDPSGARMVADLRSAGVRTETVLVRPDAPSGAALVMVDPDGENAIVVLPGANDTVTAADVAEQCRRLPAADVVLTQAELPPECMTATAEAAELLGARLLVNLAPYRPLEPSVLQRCDPLVVNEHEAAGLAAELRGGDLSAEEVLDVLAGAARSVVVTRGAGGAQLAVGATRVEVRAPAVPVVDTSGAGDAFVGAAAVELAHSGDLTAACAAGVAAGSRAVQHRGARAPIHPA